jgi:GPH family glycoside/pentoside/hexuronide:cation symporter
MSRSNHLSVGALLAYGLPMLAFGFRGGLMDFYFLKFSTDVLLIAPAGIGVIFAVSRLWDAVFDLPVGHLSDRTQTAFGKRRPWLLASIVPSCLLFVAMWSPPAALEGVALVVWTAAAVILFHSAHTMFAVPHYAMASELSSDPHQRTRLFATRLAGELGGLFLSLAALFALENSAAPRATASTVSWWAAFAAAVLVAGCVLAQRERPTARVVERERLRSVYAGVWRDVSARWLVIAAFIELLGTASLGTLLPYVSQYILNTPGNTSYYLLCFFLPMVASVPLWPRLSRRFGKRDTWIAATVVKGLGFGACFFLNEGDWLPIAVIIAVVGVADGAGRTIGPAVFADVAAAASERAQQQRDGAYFGLWALAIKVAMAASVALVGFALQATEFRPNAEQTAETEWMLRILVSVLPMAFCLAAATIVAATRSRYGEVSLIAITSREGLRQPGHGEDTVPPSP